MNMVHTSHSYCFSIDTFTVLVELPGVVDVVPDAVEATGQGRDRRHEGVAHPDDKDGVFLAKRLTTLNSLAIYVAYLLSDVELQQAAGKCHHNNSEHGKHRDAAVHDGLDGDGDGQGKRDGPEIERKITVSVENLLQFRSKSPYKPCQYKRTNQQWKHLRQNKDECGDKVCFRHGMSQRQEGRGRDCDGKIDEDGVSGDICSTAIEFSGHHSGGCRRGTEQAKHGAFQDYPESIIIHVRKQPRYKAEESKLDTHDDEMPLSEVKVAGPDGEKCQKQHEENEEGLHDADHFVDKSVG